MMQVIVTGSQIPAFETRSDGRDNLVGALIMANLHTIYTTLSTQYLHTIYTGGSPHHGRQLLHPRGHRILQPQAAARQQDSQGDIIRAGNEPLKSLKISRIWAVSPRINI